ncbi:MAG: Holliday junction branch migration protein RuvA [Butyrivibrio sp.]|uniref:Holliday junction branch migration protein RuvA n=1 Tax=Butyrivibrio sp. TaxID=28121 RepID=UPI0025D4C3BC|nr:Holliday junction branch migration protein RuvA [Butyrivibrio sp.]MCR5771035.1 Holliday junction branch migration protein RuvA [Butyrivibrio sp.]
MIAYVQGILENLEIDKAVIDVGGIGYEVNISASTCDRMPGIGESVKLYTYMNVKEDEMSLFGFLTRDEIRMFRMLITVSGIGPKGALSILSVFDTDDLRFAILSGDTKTISKAPGIGKKTAERLVLELRDKISNADIKGSDDSAAAGSLSGISTKDEDVSSRDEAVEALAALGYNATDAMKAVRKVLSSSDEKLDTEAILKLALKELF